MSTVVFFPAGGDTTATALSALFFYLSRNSAAYSKLANEIRTTFSSHSEIQGGPSLQAVATFGPLLRKLFECLRR